MGSSTDSSGAGVTPGLSPAFRDAFQRAAGVSGRLAFDRFMALALYDPSVGYYRRDRPRVGFAPGTDFFTASSSGPVFGELIATAAAQLLAQAGADPADFTFVEIGAETPSGVLTDAPHPFGAVRTLRLGEPLTLSGRCVVFSNELFDAQPCCRFVYRAAGWQEIGVTLRDDRLVEDEFTPGSLPPVLPAEHLVGYRVDLPLAAADLANSLAEQPWSGLFLACDYGKTWRELIEATPQGTARAYHRHTQSNDLLAQPGEQDLTCHICWDWLADALSRHGFAAPTVVSQESFFVHHAERYIAEVSTAEATGFSRRKLALLQLLHPSHLGQKFQVLHAWRPTPPPA